MRETVADLVSSTRAALRPWATSILGRIPVTSALSGVGHILMFHRVLPPQEISRYGMSAFEITPSALRSLIDFFTSRGYRIISLDDMLASIERYNECERFVVLTFDDGYRDTFTNAYPILKEYRAPFTVGITWNFVERAVVKWDYLAEDVVRQNQTLEISTTRGLVELDCSDQREKQKSCAILQRLLFESNVTGTNASVREFFESYVSDVYRKTDELMLTWSQIEELAKDPLVSIAAHSLNHPVLSQLTDTQVEQEVLQSKNRLESRLGIEVPHFIFPYGGSHEAGVREFEIAKKCGYRSALTGTKGNIFQQHAQSRFSLPRFCLGSNCTRDHLAGIANGSLPFVANRFQRMPTVSR